MSDHEERDALRGRLASIEEALAAARRKSLVRGPRDEEIERAIVRARSIIDDLDRTPPGTREPQRPRMDALITVVAEVLFLLLIVIAARC